jgi:MOSC domain-containing protein YiiM
MTALELQRAPGKNGTVIEVRHLFISSGHSFFGRHGQPAAEIPFREVAEVECVAGRGLRGDRFFDYKPDYKGQVTFFASEVFERLARELKLAPELSAGHTRRNIITRGMDLNTLIGKEFQIQGVTFCGAQECAPCEWMNHAFGDARAEDFLRGNGGLRARILTSGVLRSGV